MDYDYSGEHFCQCNRKFYSYNPIIRWEASFSGRAPGCDEEVCVDPIYRDAVTYLQQQPEAGVRPTAAHFNLNRSALTTHLKNHHIIELEKRKKSHACTEEICRDFYFSEAVVFSMQHPKESHAKIAKIFNMAYSTFYSHLIKFHSKLVKKRFPAKLRPTFEVARKIMHEEALKEGVVGKETYGKAKDWREKHGLPSSPQKVYANQGWISWKDFLGTSWPSLEDFIEIVRRTGPEAGVKNSVSFFKAKEWRKLHRLPGSPKDLYENWPGWDVIFDR